MEALERVGRRDIKTKIPMFCGKLNPEECMDWIEALDNHFEFDSVPEAQRLKIAKAKMKGSSLSWWNFLQIERLDENKNAITTWKRMKLEVKRQFIPKDYEVLVHQKLQALRQNDMDVGAYTEEFH